jgi:hypothetical protein
MRQRIAAAGLSLFLAACGGNPNPPPTALVTNASTSADDSGAPRRALFPPTPANVALELVFNYAVPNVDAEIGVVDVVWGAGAPVPRGIFNQSYTTFEREDAYGPNAFHTRAWWLAHHPNWIEYLCDRTTIAYEFGDRQSMPLDIANPAVLEYQRASAVDPALKAGYQGMAFDNLELSNGPLRCGHYSSNGTWVRQYSGRYHDPAYARDVIAWARSTFAYVHAFSPKATMAINFSYDFGYSFARNLDLMTQTDMDLDERGFTNWGSKPNVPTQAQWNAVTGAIDALQARRSCYMENGEEPGLSARISQAERLWVVGNYLLTRDACTYVWMSGFTASGAQDYGRIILFPEYALKVGAPLGGRTRVARGWERAYQNGLVVVNPSDAPIRVPLSRPYVDENGTAYSGSMTMSASSAQILLTQEAR